MAKVAVSMIVFNMDYVLEAALESVYPFVSQIVITEGPVKYYVDKGFTTSTDNTVEIIKSFPDPDRKIKLIRGQWKEKTEMVKVQTQHISPDTTHCWIVDADEVYKSSDVQTIIKMLPDYDSVAFCSLSFLGGFGHVVGGWEQEAQYHRIKRWNPAGWKEHRAAQMLNPETGRPWKEYHHLSADALVKKGIYLYHYTYVWPRQVRDKIRYYQDTVGDRIIPDFYGRVWLPWVIGTKGERKRIEKEYKGVHEWKPEYRGSCYPVPFTGRHPKSVRDRLPVLRKRLAEELKDA